MQDFILSVQLENRASQNSLLHIHINLHLPVKNPREGKNLSSCPGKLVIGLVKLTVREFLIMLVITYKNGKCFIHWNSIGEHSYIF